MRKASLIWYPNDVLTTKFFTAVARVRPSPHPRSTTTSSFVALATSSILRTTSCGEETNGAQLILFQTLCSVERGLDESNYLNNSTEKSRETPRSGLL